MIRWKDFGIYIRQQAPHIFLWRVLTDEMRLAILKLKYETPDTEKIMGVEYYQAVIQDGVRSYPEFEEWRRLHPVVGVVEWMP